MPRGRFKPRVIPAGEFTWTRAIDGGSANYDYYNSVVMDPQGNLIIGGSLTDGTGTQQFAVSKVDPTGTTLLWQRTFTGELNFNNECRSVAVDFDGNVAATGTLQGNESRLNLIVMKWDANGTPLWSAPQGFEAEPSNDEAGNAVRMDGVGNVIVAGYASTTDTGNDFLVAKFAGSDGTLVWSYTLDGGTFDGEAALALTTVAGTAEVPNAQDDVVAVGTLGGDTVTYAVQIQGDSPGPETTIVWERYISQDRDGVLAEGLSVAADSNNDVFVGGVLGSVNDSDFFIDKLSGADGSDAWAAPITIDGGANSFDGVNQVAVDSSGNVAAAGELTDSAGTHFAVAEFQGSDGSQLWRQTIDGDTAGGDNEALAIAVDSSDSVVAAGYLTNDSNGMTFAAAKWGFDGKQAWVRQTSGGGGDGDEALSVAVDGDGNVAAVGQLDSVATGIDGGVGYVDQEAPSITNASLDTYNLPNSGGTSNLQATVDDNIAVDSVTAQIINPDNSSTFVAVPPAGGQAGPDVYAVALSFPANPTNTEQDYEVLLNPVDTTGNEQEPLDFGAVAVAPDTTPPSLGGASVNPRSVPKGGGSVALGVMATDDGMLASVVAKITLPDTTEVSVPLSLTGNTYTGSYDAPANAGTTDAVYAVKFVATDAAANFNSLDGDEFTVAGADTTPPVISNISLLPSQLPQSGGTIKIGATVTDNVGVQSVTATFTSTPTTASHTGSATKRVRPTGNTVTLTLQSGNDYAGALDVPANFTGSAILYSFTIVAKDTSMNTQSASAGSVRQSGDTQPPAITACDVNPRALGSGGGTVTITATVTDDVGLSDVSARVSLPNSDTQLLSMSPQGGNNYSVTYSAPANTSPGPQSYGVAIVATDSSANQQTQDCGSFTVASRDAVPPVITNQHLSPTTLGPAGGPVTIFADVTDNGAVGTVTAQITSPGGNVTTRSMALVGGSTYQAVFNTPQNVGAQDLTYTVQIQATDTSSNTSNASAGSFTVQAKDVIPPGISNSVLSPSTLPQGGGTVTISADVTDNRAVATVIARITRPDSSQVDVALTQVQRGQSTFRGTFTAPSNGTQSDQQYQVVIIATDTSSNTSNFNGGAITVSGPPADTTPPTLSACDVSPSSFPYTGGTVQLTVTATDDVQVAAVTARLTGPDGVFSDVNLTLTSGNVYQGTFVAPPNFAPSAQTYTVEYRSVDTSGNPAALSCGSFTVGVDADGPTYSNLSVNPQTLPGSGGTIVITADVTDAAGLASVLGVVIYPDGSVHTFPLTHLTGSTYQGSFSVPANGTGDEQTYRVGVSARDALGNVSSQFIAGISEEVVISGKLSISTDHIDFGKVKYGTRIHGHVTVRNTSQSGQPLIITVDPLEDPFGVSQAAGTTLGGAARPHAGAQGPFTVTLPPGQGAVLDVSFGPPTTQGYADRLVIHTSDPKKPIVPVRVKGIGCRNGRPGTPIGD